jgi:hypothetical protein
VKLEDPHGSEVFHKVGITRDLPWRFSHGITRLPSGQEPTRMQKLRIDLVRAKNREPHPYRATVLAKTDFAEWAEAEAHEQEILESLTPYWPQQRFRGETECFEDSSEVIQLVASYIDTLNSDN